MRRNLGRWVHVAGALGAIALLWHSVTVRTERESTTVPVSSGGSGSRTSPFTGAVLVDLQDDATAQDRARVARWLGNAIAPQTWPSGRHALGERLSRAAQLFRVRPPAGEIGDVLRALSDRAAVEGVERERVWYLPESPRFANGLAIEPERSAPDVQPRRERPRFVPDDPYYKHQWHLDQIQMPEAWARARGAEAVVAVVDTGVLSRDRGRFRRAPDLAQTRFVSGRDFVDGDDAPDDEHGHGTHVAGTVAQSTNNGVGVAGVAPEASIMPVRVLDRRGAGRWGAVAAGIRWAADHGADVINLSLGGPMPSQTIRRAVDHAHAEGVVVIAAAGNTGAPRVGYPAMHQNTIAVGAVRFDEALTFYSAHGRGLDLVAPGGDLRVDQNGDGLPDGVLQNTMIRGDPGRHDYLAFQGTSMAAPHVAGAAALLHGAGVRDPETIRTVLTKTAKDRGDARRYGAGLVQLADALRGAARGLGGLRGGVALAVGLALLMGLRRRGVLDTPLPPTLLVGAVVAGALGVLPWGVAPGVAPLMDEASRGLPGLGVEMLGPWGGVLALHAGVPIAAVALGLGWRRVRPVVVGLSLGFAAYLGVEAAVPTTSMTPLPHWAAGPWLLAQAVFAGAVARLAATRPAGSAPPP